MAENAPPAEKIESAGRVQEMSINGQDPPTRYCYRDGVGVGSDIPVMEIGVIDVALLASPSTAKLQLQNLRSALSSFGCFMAINHGMSGSFLEEVRSVIKQFFSLPMEEKLKYGKEGESINGYGNDTILSEDQILDWNNRLILVLNPEHQRNLKFWPQNPHKFREILLEYTREMQILTEVILKAMAISLNLEDRSFLDKCGHEASLRARFNFFPPCSRHDLVLGLKPHSDSSVITIVLQDSAVEGLQYLKDNQWFKVPIIPEALLINIGEQAEIMSNGLFKSPIHRVVINPERERSSLGVFYYPDVENYIEPVEGLVDETRPKRYKRVKNYLPIFAQHYQQGKRLIDALKI
ncbi:protein SRG1-like [Mercurialis annua]|uniref:protein SRG1-like n=1 Tax=Mercurialis annua TaxID=3986 RepID=UPI00215F5069|nr:protein SRG1-like [Mercurialis annua]